MIQTVRIDSMEGVRELAFESQFNSEVKRTRGSFFYRGLSRAGYDMSTGLQRNCKGKYDQLEGRLLENFVKYAGMTDPEVNRSVWRAMIVGQHHGLPTRLLDWTHSTLVALHFANTEYNLDKLEQRDCAVWRMDARELNEKLPPEYRRVLEERNSFLFPVGELEKLAETTEKYDRDMDGKAMVTLEPPSIDQRIITQYAFFTVVPSGIRDVERYLDETTENTVKYVIDKSLRWEIRDMLDQLNMSERIFYPGIDGVTKWLSRHYYVRD